MANEEDEARKPRPARPLPKKEKRAAKAKGEGKKKAAEPTGPGAEVQARDGAASSQGVYDGTIRKPAMMKEFSYSTVMQVPRIVKVTVNMGLGKAKDEPKMIDNAIEELKADHRPVARRVARQEGHRGLQAPQGPEDRRDGHAAPRAHVGVPRPPGQHRAAARPRLPRRVAARLRRPRQLHAWA